MKYNSFLKIEENLDTNLSNKVTIAVYATLPIEIYLKIITTKIKKGTLDVVEFDNDLIITKQFRYNEAIPEYVNIATQTIQFNLFYLICDKLEV